MKGPPTDRKLLRKIYSRYYDEFCRYDADTSSRASKIYVPIDCEIIAKELKIDSEIVFGQLYYHLDKKYGYVQEDGSTVHLFAMKIGADMHAVNFPLLAAVLAELEQGYYRFLLPIAVSLFALAISIWSLSQSGT